MNAFDPRITPLFSRALLPEPVHIIGIGGVGSHVGYSLGKGGIETRIELYDADRVASHNWRNQTYLARHAGDAKRGRAGMLKVRALANQLRQWSTQVISRHSRHIEHYEPLDGIVFLCVDSMRARRVVWETCIKGNENIPLFIETRTDGVSIIIHAVNPKDVEHQYWWEHYWYPDAEAVNETAGCGGPVVVLPAAVMTAVLAVDLLASFVRIRADGGNMDDELPFQLRYNRQTFTLEAYTMREFTAGRFAETPAE